MERVIFEVDAFIVDANGVFNRLANYPKRFDSKTYNYDTENTLKRAKAEYFTTLGTMYGNQAGRQVQTAMLYNIYGAVLLSENVGYLPVIEEEAVE